MAAEKWVIVGKRWCEFRQEEATLMERRVFPSGIAMRYEAPRVIERKCDCGVDCNLAGYPCRWAFTNPSYDPFAAE